MRPDVKTASASVSLNSLIRGSGAKDGSNAGKLGRDSTNAIRFAFGGSKMTFQEVLDPGQLPSTLFPNQPFLLNAPLTLNVSQNGQPAIASAIGRALAWSSLLNIAPGLSLIHIFLVYVLGHMIWGGGKQRNPPDPEDYFKVNSDNGAGAPWRSSEHAYHVEGKWVQPKDMNDPLVMMDEGLAMPNTSDPLFRDAATKEVATFKRFHGEYDFSKFIEGTKVMWLVWVWPQATSEGRGIEAGALRYYKFTLEWRQTSHPVIVKAEYCSRPGLRCV